MDILIFIGGIFIGFFSGYIFFRFYKSSKPHGYVLKGIFDTVEQQLQKSQILIERSSYDGRK